MGFGIIEKLSKPSLLIALSGCLATACGEGFTIGADCDEPSSADLETLTGIYQTASYTQNEASCDDEGPSKLAELQEPFFFVASRKELGRDVGMLVSCSDADDCRSKKSMFSTGVSGLILESFACDGSEGGLAGNTRTTGYSTSEGLCEDPTVQDSTLTRSGTTLRMEIRVRHGESYSADGEGFCTTDKGFNAAKDAPCTELIVLTGEFVDSI